MSSLGFGRGNELKIRALFNWSWWMLCKILQQTLPVHTGHAVAGIIPYQHSQCKSHKGMSPRIHPPSQAILPRFAGNKIDKHHKFFLYLLKLLDAPD